MTICIRVLYSLIYCLCFYGIKVKISKTAIEPVEHRLSITYWILNTNYQTIFICVFQSWLYRIPITSYADNVLSFTPIDNSKDWVERCSLNNYVIDPRDASYCRNTSFALVTNFNNGALPCRCSYLGSRSRYCNQVHGQCACRRPNIIGRQCLQCRSGYYGFPYCRRKFTVYWFGAGWSVLVKIVILFHAIFVAVGLMLKLYDLIRKSLVGIRKKTGASAH